MISLLIAEDSKTVQRTLVSLLENEPDIKIVGIANDGVEAVEMCRALKPDLVTMDIFMPRMNGLEATREIMASCPTRIVIISSMVGSRDVSHSFDAMRAGAIEIIEKPGGVLTGNYSEVKNTLLNVIHTAQASRPGAQMTWLPSIPPPSPPPEAARNTPSTPPPAMALEQVDLRQFAPSMVCIGGSTGAPTVIVEILSKLPANYPFPVVVAQHISRGFARGMAGWLDNSCELTVRLAEPGDTLTRGTVLVGPDDHHLLFDRNGRIMFIEPDQRNDYIPSVNHVFSTASSAFGPGAVGVLLSGMGKDGAKGLLEMYNRGSLTICQNEKTSVVYGMPKVAAEMGAAWLSLPPLQIAQTLNKLGNLPRPA